MAKLRVCCRLVWTRSLQIEHLEDRLHGFPPPIRFNEFFHHFSIKSGRAALDRLTSLAKKVKLSRRSPAVRSRCREQLYGLFFFCIYSTRSSSSSSSSPWFYHDPNARADVVTIYSAFVTSSFDKNGGGANSLRFVSSPTHLPLAVFKLQFLLVLVFCCWAARVVAGFELKSLHRGFFFCIGRLTRVEIFFKGMMNSL